MLVVTRFRVPAPQAQDFLAEIRTLRDALEAREGFVDAFTGRNLDDATLWTFTTTWASVGAYRRALSSAEVKLAGAAPYARALVEPSAYTDAFDTVVPDTGAEGSERSGSLD